MLTDTFEKKSFIFRSNGIDELKLACNAPKNKSGVYLFYDITNSKKELIYIGCSGHITNKGEISTRKTGQGGIFGRIVNGHQFGKTKRYLSIPIEMKKENIEIIEVEWFVTFSEEYEYNFSPVYVESFLLQRYFEEFKRLPKWNKKF